MPPPGRSRRQPVMSTTASPTRSAATRCRRSGDTSPEASRSNAAATCSRSMVRTPTPTVVAAERHSVSAYTDCQSNPPRINRPAAKITRDRGHRCGQLLIVDLVAKPLAAQRVSDLQLVLAVHDDCFTPLGDKSSDVVAAQVDGAVHRSSPHVHPGSPGIGFKRPVCKLAISRILNLQSADAESGFLPPVRRAQADRSA